MRTTFARLVTLGIVLSACTAGPADEPQTTTSSTELASTTSTSTTSTSLAATTTTTQPALETSLVNGLPVDDPDRLNRRLMAVKIDNHPRANPHSGIEQADMVIELKVEGITRFITLWHESDSAFLGPNRSGRPTDASLLAPFNEPTFVLSGAQAWVRSLIAANDINTLVETEGTFRIPERSAPHNLYVNTSELRDVADQRGYQDEAPELPLWEFGPLSGSAQPASSVTMDFGSSDVIWDWDPADGEWLRTAYGAEGTYLDPNGFEKRVAVPVLIALYVEQYTATPQGGQSGTPLPSSRVTGSGAAFVFADGKYVEGTWERESDDVWFDLFDANGETIAIPPGVSWMSLVPVNNGLTIDG